MIIDKKKEKETEEKLNEYLKEYFTWLCTELTLTGRVTLDEVSNKIDELIKKI